MITLFHSNEEKADQNILNVDTNKPETLNKVLKAVIKYSGGDENVKID